MRKLLIAALLTVIMPGGFSQRIASVEVEFPETTHGLATPVSIDLDEITYVSDTLLNLYLISGGGRTPVPFQVDPGASRRLNWIVPPVIRPGEKYQYELVREKAKNSAEMKATPENGVLTIRKGDQDLLQYYYKPVYPPEGVDTVYKRSGFIHPLWSPNGQVLTRIQPPDHYHHYGIWNPWTQVEYEGETVDFWNINSKQGTVRFAKFVAVQEGPVFAEFKALHEHVVFKKTGAEKVALNEVQGVRVYRPDGKEPFYIVDFIIELNCADESPFRILEYRYAGLGWRTTEKWDNKNSMVLTSEGITRKDADGSKARWCIVQGEIDNDYAGAVIMSFPTNYNFPEPLRIWPENQYDRGDMFVNFSPTKDTDWLLEPGRKYVLKYRFLVHNGPMTREVAESAWQSYAFPPLIRINKN